MASDRPTSASDEDSGESREQPGPPSQPSDGTPSSGGAQAPVKDPLRRSRTSGVWVAVVLLVVVLVLLAVFILQNTQSVEVSFFGWRGSAPLSAALLIAATAGLVLAVAAGSLRILQLRRRVKRNARG